MRSLLAILLVAPIPVPPPSLQWAPCGTTGAECAQLTLPKDWAHPGDGTFPLRIARRHATGDRVGTLVFGPGGPWDSGVNRVKDDPDYHRFSDTLLSRFDIVSFDPRGSGRSNPVTCLDPPTTAPVAVPTNQAQFDAVVEYNRALWDSCRAGTGAVWDHADMLSNVRDLDALRAALGERRISFHGSSYGTLLGEQYAERYPGRVRAMVLESVDDHSSRTTGEFLTAQASAYEDAFDAFADWCAAPSTTREQCELHGRDVRAIWRGQATFDLRAWTLKLLKDAKYTQLASYLAGVEDRGDPPIELPGIPIVVPSFCADWSLPVRDYAQFAALLRRTAKVAPDTAYPAQVYALTTCLGWENVANPQHRPQIRTAVPILLLNSRHDPATGLNWARTVERQLGRDGVLVTYDGAGHGSYSLSPCMKRTADDYLVSLTVPARGTTCATA